MDSDDWHTAAVQTNLVRQKPFQVLKKTSLLTFHDCCRFALCFVKLPKFTHSFPLFTVCWRTLSFSVFTLAVTGTTLESPRWMKNERCCRQQSYGHFSSTGCKGWNVDTRNLQAAFTFDTFLLKNEHFRTGGLKKKSMLSKTKGSLKWPLLFSDNIQYHSGLWVKSVA